MPIPSCLVQRSQLTWACSHDSDAALMKELLLVRFPLLQSLITQNTVKPDGLLNACLILFLRSRSGNRSKSRLTSGPNLG